MKARRYQVGISEWFSRFETSPGRIDPRTGKLVSTTAITSPAAVTSGFARFETSPGYIDPRTGKLVHSTVIAPGVPAALPPRAAASTSFKPRSWSPAEAGMEPAATLSGASRRDVGWTTVGVALLGGFALAAILEATGVLKLSGGA